MALLVVIPGLIVYYLNLTFRNLSGLSEMVVVILSFVTGLIALYFVPQSAILILVGLLTIVITLPLFAGRYLVPAAITTTGKLARWIRKKVLFEFANAYRATLKAGRKLFLKGKSSFLHLFLPLIVALFLADLLVSRAPSALTRWVITAIIVITLAHALAPSTYVVIAAVLALFGVILNVVRTINYSVAALGSKLRLGRGKSVPPPPLKEEINGGDGPKWTCTDGLKVLLLLVILGGSIVAYLIYPRDQLPPIREASEQRRALNDHWIKYLKEIQTDNAYPNWSSPPHDLYLRNQKK